MRLLRLGAAGAERPAVEGDDGVVYDASGVATDFDGDFFASGGIARIRSALDAGFLPSLAETKDLRIGSPISRPAAVICVGMNYAAHAAESGSAPPVSPVIFFKHPNTVVGPFDDVKIPPGATKVDWEVELAVVIGSRASYLPSPAAARECIAGYAISNDVSERDYQLENGQWSKGKSCETFNPLGPYLVPREDIDSTTLRLRSSVNGALRQDSSTADMITGVDELIWHISQYLVLEPGDVVNTGTPEGVALSGRYPYLQPGDEMSLSIEGLGEQRSILVDGRD
ncbi:fumarylacetoacetate hydrolase family protein [Diaminobutyricibacter sp. McL0608]|uniref:fumarylacetoacetate hydrolase family protein n=1 Tax=Leifsonia sp. McL0608 TaxID=3143537 RepID=UPI0031F2DB43